MIFPHQSTAPMPSEDMPMSVKADYMEARSIVDDSPRAATALLRLAIEKLLSDELEAEGDSIYNMIGDLVENNRVDDKIQKAYDSVRVYGNESVHPGRIDMRDDVETAQRLFQLVNVIIKSTIQEDKLIDEMYEEIPASKKEGIESRDS